MKEKTGQGVERARQREAEQRRRERDRVKDAAPAKVSRQQRRFYERKGR